MDFKNSFLLVALVLLQVPSLLADEATLSSANELYAKKSYPEAGKAYRAYLTASPNGKERGQAYYRMGECFLKQANNGKGGKDQGWVYAKRFSTNWMEKKAMEAYSQMLKELPKDDYAAPSAYRIGALHFNRKEFGKAASFFETAASKTDKEQIRQSSQYYQARSLKLSGQSKKALLVYKSIADRPDSNIYKAQSSLAVAELCIKLKKPDEAREILEDFLETKRAPKQMARAEELLQSIASDEGE